MDEKMLHLDLTVCVLWTRNKNFSLFFFFFVLWTRNKNFSLFFFFSQGRTRNSKFIEKCDFFTHFLVSLYVFATNLCECRARWLFLDWLMSTCPALHVSFLYGFLDGSYVNLAFSLIILLIIISLENLVLDQLKKSPNWYFLHSHHFSAWYYWFDVEKFFLGTHRSKRVKIHLGLPSHGNLSGSLDEYLIDKLTLVLGQCWLQGWKKWYSYFVFSGSSLTRGVLDV